MLGIREIDNGDPRAGGRRPDAPFLPVVPPGGADPKHMVVHRVQSLEGRACLGIGRARNGGAVQERAEDDRVEHLGPVRNQRLVRDIRHGDKVDVALLWVGGEGANVERVAAQEREEVVLFGRAVDLEPQFSMEAHDNPLLSNGVRSDEKERTLVVGLCLAYKVQHVPDRLCLWGKVKPGREKGGV